MVRLSKLVKVLSRKFETGIGLGACALLEPAVSSGDCELRIGLLVAMVAVGPLNLQQR